MLKDGLTIINLNKVQVAVRGNFEVINAAAKHAFSHTKYLLSLYAPNDHDQVLEQQEQQIAQSQSNIAFLQMVQTLLVIPFTARPSRPTLHSAVALLTQQAMPFVTGVTVS